jgi:uncharacterized protein YegP (UPF0339 family)
MAMVRRMDRPQVMRTLKKQLGMLEYCESKGPGGKRGKWSFRFKTPDGNTLMESRKKFDSLAKAEKGFFEAVKKIATNQYTINYPAKSSASRN